MNNGELLNHKCENNEELSTVYCYVITCESIDKLIIDNTKRSVNSFHKATRQTHKAIVDILKDIVKTSAKVPIKYRKDDSKSTNEG